MAEFHGIEKAASPVLRGSALRATHLRMRLERGRGRAEGGQPRHRREVGRRHAQRSALILRCPAGASKDEGGWLGCHGIGKVASPVLRGSALRATHLRMRLERGHACGWREGGRHGNQPN
ncbi:hypothetical protein B5K08_05265 [Rhizobium leguminosarum bv. trifolii]|uniref:Uncharacterized protein n=1 Tax=Rhizobium leguminosarum bv. trifolii TaxID=386 RepID=A0A3E1BXM5_RHILT|nr:hypothetical protein B5K08_05265 [Rhizobium leguminosarum bv. trifolii]RFB99916.1 hypothetical protein B5K10_05255 [Rhizobium leguminosarum bv. trifolii]